LTVTGTPASETGATWTYKASVDEVSYDLSGILFKPSTGTGPFPAVIINHGTGGNAYGYSKNVAKEMVKWGMVCIAVNLTHSANVPLGSPGTAETSDWGASIPNMQRAMKCRDILASLGYVNMNCIMAFGHSRGAFLTTAIAGVYPDKFSAAGHTAGGISDQTPTTFPTTAMAENIKAPYIIHHGTNDVVVSILADQSLVNLLTSKGVTHQFHTYEGYSHSDISMDSEMFLRTRNWFTSHGCPATAVMPVPGGALSVRIHPNPARSNVYIELNNCPEARVKLINLLGETMVTGLLHTGENVLDVDGLPSGLYFLSISGCDIKISKKLLIGK
jgi:dienelactone hydrolase